MAINPRNGKRGMRWVVDYRDAHGKRRYVTCLTKAEARRVEADKIRERGGNPHARLVDVASAWYSLARSRVRSQSLDAYRRILDIHILPALGERSIAKVRPTEIEAFLASKLKAGLSPKSVSCIQSVLFGILRHATRDGVIASNPAQGLARELGLKRISPMREEKVKAFTRDELEKFLDVCKATAPRMYPLWLTMARTGIRIGEAIALEWQDVDLEGTVRQGRLVYQATIRQSMKRDGIPDATKSNRIRRVDLSTGLRMVLAEHRKGWIEEGLALGAPREPWVFQREPGLPRPGRFFRRRMLQAEFKLALARAQLSGHYTPHSLRHTFASVHIQMGTPLGYVMRQLGHSSIQMTMDIYGHWLSDTNPDAADRLDAAEVQDNFMPREKKT